MPEPVPTIPFPTTPVPTIPVPLGPTDIMVLLETAKGAEVGTIGAGAETAGADS